MVVFSAWISVKNGTNGLSKKPNNKLKTAIEEYINYNCNSWTIKIIKLSLILQYRLPHIILELVKFNRET